MTTPHYYIINKAIAAHGVWKSRLIEAISTGKCNISAKNALRVDVCDLGKWIYGENLLFFRGNPQYTALEKVHAEFHARTGEILKLAENGETDRASELLERDQPFAQTSVQLVKCLKEFGAFLEEHNYETKEDIHFSVETLFGLNPDQ